MRVILLLLCTSPLAAQFNQVSLDFGRNENVGADILNQLSLSYTRSFTKNERHLIEGGVVIIRDGLSLPNQLYGLYRFRVDGSMKWDFSLGLGVQSNHRDLSDYPAFIASSVTLRYNLTRFTSLRLRTKGLMGETLFLRPSLGITYRWPGQPKKTTSE
jgi:hypothetical protein